MHCVCIYTFTLIRQSFSDFKKEFGREFSQLSRISNRIKGFLLTRHSNKVLCNLDWYADKFDLYADSVNRAIAYSPINQQPRTLPPELVDILAFLDGTIQLICKITAIKHLYYSIKKY
jgi:hypothetical protein